MKTMNYLLTIALFFMAVSCSKEAPSENEELAETNFRGRMHQEQEESQEVFELDLHQYYVLRQLVKLEEQKKELEEEIEGGNEKLISTLEAVVLEIETNFDQLETILNVTCVFLETEVTRLVEEAKDGNAEAEAQLQKLNQSNLKKCGINVREYFYKEIHTYAFMLIGKDDGGDGNCIPTGDDCPTHLDAGRLLINVLEEDADNLEAIVTTPQGEVIGEGELIGAHPILEGVFQVAFDLEPIEKANIEVNKEGGSHIGTVTIIK